MFDDANQTQPTADADQVAGSVTTPTEPAPADPVATSSPADANIVAPSANSTATDPATAAPATPKTSLNDDPNAFNPNILSDLANEPATPATEPAANSNPVADTPVLDTSATSDIPSADLPAPESTAETSTSDNALNDTATDDSSTDSTPPATEGSGDLLQIKQDALQQLEPLVGHLDQSPEEKFRTLMQMIQAADNQTLLQQAYDTAKNIGDEKARAQALLDVVNEINYFTQQPEADKS